MKTNGQENIYPDRR